MYYMRCVGLLMKETKFEEVRYIIYSVLVIAYSETEGIFEIIIQCLMGINFTLILALHI